MLEQPLHLPPELLRLIRQVLADNPEGTREIDLIDILSEHLPELISREALNTPLSRFRTHFLLFHALYQLRALLFAEQSGILEIAPLMIQIHPWSGSNSQNIDLHDALEAYYLNWENLMSTNEDDVGNLLAGFWKRMIAPNEVQNALLVMNLKPQAGWTEMKQQYRQLCMAHHPDRGGNTADYQALQSAYQTLKQRYAP